MDKLISVPVASLSGEVRVPSDKSITHRAFMLSAIASGQSVIRAPLYGQDNLATLQALSLMGVTTKQSPSDLIIHGVGKNGLCAPTGALDCGNSGTAMRLLAGLLAGQSFDSELIGDASLSQRPMGRIVHPLRRMQAKINMVDGEKPPLRIQGGQPLVGINYALPVASAQIKSSLLLAGLYAKGETTITEPGISRNHTELMLRSMGYPIEISHQKMTIPGSLDKALDPIDMEIPADLSSAAFFIVAATIVPGSTIQLNSVGVNPTRIGLFKILNAMGANITLHNHRYFGSEPVADIEVHSASLKGIDVPRDWVPLAIDELPILMIAAAVAEGETRFVGIEELRVKESDRIHAMVQGLNALGVNTNDTNNSLTIQGGSLSGGEVDSFGDHRIAMSFCIAGSVATGQVIVQDCESIATSFPGFNELSQAIGLDISSSF